MSEREQRVNQGLRILDEAHYTGRITREEYRKRRRQLLGSLCDSHGITARNTLRTRITQPGGRRAAVATEPLPVSRASRRVVAWKPLLAFGCGVLVCALLLYWLMRAD